MNLLKVFWHIGLTLGAAWEYRTATSDFRRAFLGGCIGYHAAATHNDYITWQKKRARPDAGADRQSSARHHSSRIN